MTVHLRLPRTVRSIQRVQHIARVLTRHGLGHLVDRLPLSRFVPMPRLRRKPEEATADLSHASLGQRLVRAFEELGTTFIKLGQMISTRPDVFPADIVDAMVKLQDHVPPFDTAVARRIIASNLGREVDACFSEFAAEPFASGSIAQVYRAATRPDPGRPAEKVVVKVRRPDIDEVIRLDMGILRWLADVAERLIPEWAVYQPRAVVEEFERTLIRELDFVNEAATISRFAETFGYDPAFRVPRVHWELSGPAVLTLEELPGVSAQVMLAQDDGQINRKVLADRLAKAFVRQFFEIGMFHADPHPGNLLITPPANVGLIDFGLTGQIDDDMLGYLVVALLGAFNREAEVIVEVLAEMNALGDDTDRRQLRRAFLELIDKYYGLPLYRFDPQTLFYEITGLVQQQHVSLPREFVLLGKSLVGVGGVCLQLDPQMDLLELVKPKLKGILARRMTPQRLIKAASISGWHLFHILKSAPGQIRDVSRRLARGKWQVNIRHQNLDYLATEMDRASNRLSFAVVIGAIIVGSSWIISAPSTSTFLGVRLPVFGIVGYLVAGVMGLTLVVSILRSGKLS
ncbi:MAG: AarF/ABC1/UbiB kinase family protein [Phycisphaerae bacterium]|jgi:ubiquinone biosynthesis protein